MEPRSSREMRITAKCAVLCARRGLSQWWAGPRPAEIGQFLFLVASALFLGGAMAYWGY